MFAQSKMRGGEAALQGWNGMGMRNDCLCTFAKAGSSSQKCFKEKKAQNHKTSADPTAKLERGCT